MRTISASLLAAQQGATANPYVKVDACNKRNGVVHLRWSRLYTGTEEDTPHAAAIPADGSLNRVCFTPPADGRKLYHQRVTEPGESSDFTNWTYSGQYGCLAVAAAASAGSEVSIFWINDSQELRRIKRTDSGAGWGSSELLDYTATTEIGGLAAAYKPNGDLAVFFADQETLYVKKRTGGNWQSKTAWDKATGILSGAAVIYDSDWNLLISGKDAAGNFKVWSLIYGDGGNVSGGEWTDLQDIASAPADGEFEYANISLVKPDVFRGCYTEKFSGTEPYARPFLFHSLPGSDYTANLWTEPTPFNLTAENGLAMADDGDYCWLTTPGGVWRADPAEECLNITADITSLTLEQTKDGGQAVIQLRNDDGRYAALPPPLDNGCRLSVSPGFVTTEGNEASGGLSFIMADYEYVCAGGRAGLLLRAEDGWAALRRWRARHQFRWNRNSEEMNVRQILSFVLARCGLSLNSITESAVITSTYPDFTIHTGDQGDTIVRQLLTLIPDIIFMEGDTAYLVLPLASDTAVYAYGTTHPLFECGWRRGAWDYNRVMVEGFDPAEQERIVAEAYDWTQLEKHADRLVQIEDINITSPAEAAERGAIVLRKAELASAYGSLAIPVNCGQQLYDVISITESRIGFAAETKRVTGIYLSFNPAKGEYKQRLTLGEV